MPLMRRIFLSNFVEYITFTTTGMVQLNLGSSISQVAASSTPPAENPWKKIPFIASIAALKTSLVLYTCRGIIYHHHHTTTSRLIKARDLALDSIVPNKRMLPVPPQICQLLWVTKFRSLWPHLVVSSGTVTAIEE